MVANLQVNPSMQKTRSKQALAAELPLAAARARLTPKRPPKAMATKLWIDVEDFFEYGLSNFRPSGIQRLSFEVCRTLQEHHGGTGNLHFIRHAPVTRSFQVVPWRDITELFDKMSGGATPPSCEASPPAYLRRGPVWQRVRKLLHRLPPPARLAAVDVALTGIQAIRAWRRLFSILPPLVAPMLSGSIRWRDADRGTGILDATSSTILARDSGSASTVDPRDAFAGSAVPGDVLLVLGSPWSHPDYAELVRRQCKRLGLRFALLVYDLIPIRRPEWCDPGLAHMFRDWVDGVLPLCDHVFAVSRATAADVECYALERGIVLPRRVLPLPVGTGLGKALIAAQAAVAACALAPRLASASRLPSPGSYALIVSTIEARKNHLLLFRVWRRLLEDLPREQVPTLVFAGRVGWLAGDLMRQIANTANLDGKLVLVESPTDLEIAALYAGCLFTLFPSFHEGWSLPVTESLAFGKPCVISNATSLPEAGGSLARLFDPGDMSDAYAVIRDLVVDRPGLAAWELRVRREFEPVPWIDTVDALLASLAADPDQ